MKSSVVIYSIVLFPLLDSSNSFAANTNVDVAEAFQKNEIIPDVLDSASAPGELLNVKFGSEKVNLGNELTPTKVQKQPIVKWTAEANKYYVIAMTDPDAPSRKNPTYREWSHWIVVNIPGSQVEKGDILSAYISAGPPKGTGLHRYVLLAYEQPDILTFDELRLTNTSGKNRGKFSISNFADKYKLGKPIAGNFFQAQYDSYVDVLQAQLTGKK